MFPAHERTSTLRLIVIALALVGVLMLILRPGSSAQRLVSHWQPAPLLTAPEPQAQQPGAPAPEPIAGDARPLDQFDIQVDDGLYADERAALNGDLQAALGYVVGRFGSGPSARFTAMVLNEGGCGLHGISYTDIRQVQVFSCPGIGRDRAVAIMAHEFAHQLEQDRYGPAHLSSDLILSEGAATWAAGKYWLGDAPSFRAYVHAQRSKGTYYPLATDYNGLGIGAMNALYYEWASFVEFLVNTYGREQFDRVYVSGGGAIGAADYQGVYGKPLAALQQEWLAWIDSA
jgi:hypothetical protein